MTDEEYQEQQELERLINEYNRLVDERNRLVAEYNALVEELQYAFNATVDSINFAAKVQNYVVPRLNESVGGITEVAGLVGDVKYEIEQLSDKYFMIKNISTASKKLTGLDNEYHRNFGLYSFLRRVALGYVVGIDNNIISNEKLRETVEKNYLQNVDYWISHCLMATMLWVSDEKEAAERAINKAMSIDPHKSSLYFLLINLHFGRSEAAAMWFEYYIQDVDVNNIGEEIRILLQAYLYNVCGNDEEFKNKIKNKFNDLLSSVRNNTSNYNNLIKAQVLEYISAHVHKTTEEFVELQRTCKDYTKLIEALSNAEKNALFAKEFESLYNDDTDTPKNLTERIRNVLYDLINTYDEAEMRIIKDMDYNEMILKARGDIAAAQKMYAVKYRPGKPRTMGSLMVRLAMPSENDEVDIRVRRFAIAFLCEDIIRAFEEFKKQYNRSVKTVHEANIDSFNLTIDEKEPENAKKDLVETFKKNRKKMIARDKKVKTLTVFTWIFWAAWVITTVISGFVIGGNGEWPAVLIILFAVTFVLAVAFTIWLVFQRKKAGEEILERMNRDLETLDKVIRAIQDWREKFTLADKQSEMLAEVLNRFSTKEEGVK